MLIASISVVSTWLELNSELFCEMNNDDDFGTFDD